jgi:hypothetical protein
MARTVAIALEADEVRTRGRMVKSNSYDAASAARSADRSPRLTEIDRSAGRGEAIAPPAG